MHSATGDIIYSFRRGERGLQLSSTAVHPVVARSEPKKPVAPGGPLPTEVTLTNGVTLHHVTVVQWQSDKLVLRHDGGTAPIRLEHIIPDHRAHFTANLQRELELQTAANNYAARQGEAEQQMRSYQEQMQTASVERQAQRQAEIEEAISHHRLMVGMTMLQVRSSWGTPNRTTTITHEYGPGTVWFYDGRGIDAGGNAANAGVSFIGDIVVSLYNVKAR